MDLKMFIDLFQEIEVENLFKALDLCMEYARLDLHVFNIGAHVTCSYFVFNVCQRRIYDRECD